MEKKSIYIFQRSLRLHDNLGLIQALKESDKVYPVFCVDPRQAIPKKNSYFSKFALGFMYQSLLDLDKELKRIGSKLYILYGEPHLRLRELLIKYKITSIYINEDYTPFAKKRTAELKRLTTTTPHKCDLIEVFDYLLFKPKSILNGSGKAYRVYTPFLKKTESKKVKNPIPCLFYSKFAKSFPTDLKAWSVLKKNSRYSPSYSPGGRTEALKRLKLLPGSQKDYSKCRNYLSYKSSNLSAYIKFGCISIREAWKAFSKITGTSGKDLQKQLIWREFYYHMYFFFPKQLEWDKDPIEAKLSSKAPDIVKACFNQLKQEGYISNRSRMILANWLLHNQKVYWKNCDKMYAKLLVDYDPIVNIGNWKWILKQPKFRWLKPEVQAKRWDVNCLDKKEKNAYTQKYT